jgi:cob(I)alamin adenosyltransferase
MLLLHSATAILYITTTMKIYTKTGDKGQTSLIGGTRVPKHHSRIEAYGTVDELNSFVGLIRDHNHVENHINKTLLEIQDRLFTLEAHLAEDPNGVLTRKLPQLNDQDVVLLENEIDRMNESLPELTSFILPGGHPLVSYCHVARTVCRRAERVCIMMAESYEVPAIDLQYLNRLSDYFFVLARYFGFLTKSTESPWKPRQ